MSLALLGKGGKQCIEIGSGSGFVLLLPELAKQIGHGGTFVYEGADIALRLAQADRLREGSKCLRLLMEFLVGESLQEADFHHIFPTLTCGGSLECRL